MLDNLDTLVMHCDYFLTCQIMLTCPIVFFFFFWWDRDDLAEPILKWHVYVTGHSLGGALATLLALELSSSQLAK